VNNSLIESAVKRPTTLKDDLDEVKRWLEVFGGGLFREVPEHERKSAVDRVVDALRLAMYDSSEGRWLADHRRILIVCKKTLRE